MIEYNAAFKDMQQKNTPHILGLALAPQAARHSVSRPLKIRLENSAA